MGKRVLLGMSGGVDSSVSAILLKQQGYDVIGVTMKLYDGEEEGSCCNINSCFDAKRVCDYLNIPHYTLNFVENFKQCVIKDFIENYKNCKTPNPCIECNKYMKFGLMWQKAKELDCDYIATGHYAKIEFDENYNQIMLKKANCLNKDQSYVLYNLPKFMLDKFLLPLGSFNSKDEIREIAKTHNLLVASKPDSQDICFVPSGKYSEFLEKNAHFEQKVGEIVTKNGEIIGKHTGLYKYTIGQRKGLNIAYKHPLYVVGFNQKDNQLIVGEEKDLYKTEMFVNNLNFLVNIEKINLNKLKVKTRYKSIEQTARIEIINKDNIKVIFNNPVARITPGQSAVFYDDDCVIGGGKII